MRCVAGQIRGRGKVGICGDLGGFGHWCPLIRCRNYAVVRVHFSSSRAPPPGGAMRSAEMSSGGFSEITTRCRMATVTPSDRAKLAALEYLDDLERINDETRRQAEDEIVLTPEGVLTDAERLAVIDRVEERRRQRRDELRRPRRADRHRRFRSALFDALLNLATAAMRRVRPRTRGAGRPRALSRTHSRSGDSGDPDLA